MKVNDAPVEDGKTHAELQQIAGTWGAPWYKDPKAGNGYPILQWQYDRGDYATLCGFPKEDGVDSTTDRIPGKTDVIYDLSGRRIQPAHRTPSRGLYIVNGRKVLY